jgi:molecular chaperone HtpG
VRISTRLVDSPACLVVEEGDMSGHLARLLKQAGQSAPVSLPILEINPQHALVTRVQHSEGEPQRSLAQVLVDQAILAEGGQLDDPAAFLRRVNALILNA